jgi:hypothetical protein
MDIKESLISALRMHSIDKLASKYPNADWENVFSKGQLESKTWLIEKLLHWDVDLGIVYMCGGWYGQLASMLFISKLPIIRIYSYDIDPLCTQIANDMNSFKYVNRFMALTEDIHNLDYNKCDTIINTSCEHIKNFSDWYDNIPDNKLLILQSNNFSEIEEHVNCVTSLEEFKQQCYISNLLYSGELDIDVAGYTRYMLIGRK